MMTILKVFNVNHGDAMLFQPDCVFQDIPLLIDTGNAKHNIYKKISNEKFDIMITHQDGDHMAGLGDFLKYKLHNIQNIYLPLYQPEINKIFLKLRDIGKKNATEIQNSENFIHKYVSKVIFVYDGWHNERSQYNCNLAKCSYSEILNPPLDNFTLLNNNSKFLDFTFEQALKYIYEEAVFDEFDVENYIPENLHNQNPELIEARKEYFKYVIRLIGYTIFVGNWRKDSAKRLYRLVSNDVSIILHYKRKNRFSILFTGDAGDKILKKLIQQKKLNQIDILKVPHHGGNNSVGKKILSTLQPKYAILSHANGKFGTGIVPTDKSLIELQSKPITILATNKVTRLAVSSPIKQALGICPITIVNKLDSIEFI